MASFLNSRFKNFFLNLTEWRKNIKGKSIRNFKKVKVLALNLLQKIDMIFSKKYSMLWFASVKLYYHNRPNFQFHELNWSYVLYLVILVKLAC